MQTIQFIFFYILGTESANANNHKPISTQLGGVRSSARSSLHAIYTNRRIVERFCLRGSYV